MGGRNDKKKYDKKFINLTLPWIVIPPHTPLNAPSQKQLNRVMERNEFIFLPALRAACSASQAAFAAVAF